MREFVYTTPWASEQAVSNPFARLSCQDLYTKNEADSLVWLGDVPIGTKVSRCPPNGISQGEVRSGASGALPRIQ